jgi:UPF0755 protein
MIKGTGNRIRRWEKKHFAGVAAIVLVLFSSVFFYLVFVPDYGPVPSNAQEIVAMQGEKPSDVVEMLREKGYIKNTRLLKIALAIASVFKKIEAGGYYITQGMNEWQIFRSLANPSMRYVAVSAGLRKQEIADFVGDKLGWDTVEKREFVNIHMDLKTDDLEGKYFPDTYLISIDANPEEVGKLMVDNYDEKIAFLKKKYPNSTVNYDTALRIASIIQREAAGSYDMRLISGIIWNRLFKGMSLSMDATVQYAKGKQGENWWPQVTAQDIRQIDSPYNTYKNKGMPPSPISSPGLPALEAAMNPQKTSCLFYIHDRNRTIHCAQTADQHQRNIDAYLK